MHFDTLGGFVSAQSFDSFGTVFWLPAPFGTWKKQKEVNSAPAHKLTWWLWRRRRWALVRALVDAEGCSQPVMVATRWGPEISCLERNPYHWYPSYVCAFLITSHGRKNGPLHKLDWWISIQLSAINSNLPKPQWKVAGNTSSGPSSQLGPAATENRSHKKRWPWPHAATRSVGSLALERISKRQRNIQKVSNSYKLVWQKCCEQEHDSNLGWTEKLWLAHLWFKKKDSQPHAKMDQLDILSVVSTFLGTHISNSWCVSKWGKHQFWWEHYDNPLEFGGSKFSDRLMLCEYGNGHFPI